MAQFPGANTPPPRSWSWPRFTRNAAIIIALASLATWFVLAGVLPNLRPKNFAAVEPGVLYRSGVLTTAAFRDVVQNHDIRTVIDFGGHAAGSPGERREDAAAQALGVDLVRLPLYGDGTGDPNRYAQALRIIQDPASHPVLVHCSAGSERTGAAVALYRHILQGQPLDQAYSECSLYRHDPARNPRLRPMLDQWADDVARSLATGEPIAYDGASPP